jgi:hypothetical protein
VSERASIFLGLTALELSIQNTLTIAENGMLSPDAAESLLEKVASGIEVIETELGVSLASNFDEMFINIRHLAKMAWKTSDQA